MSNPCWGPDICASSCMNISKAKSKEGGVTNIQRLKINK